MRPWFERRFSFDHLGPEDFPYLLERLSGAPARVEEKTRELSREVLTQRTGEAWSIQEHVGPWRTWTPSTTRDWRTIARG